MVVLVTPAGERLTIAGHRLTSDPPAAASVYELALDRNSPGYEPDIDHALARQLVEAFPGVRIIRHVPLRGGPPGCVY